jgi:hypothetical protein
VPPSTSIQTLNATAYTATSESPAYGHYDLLTTLLHEISYLQGFIKGYNGFDNHIQTVDGSQVFFGSDFTAKLVNNHLDPKAYPNDLLNPILTPSTRQLTSNIDRQLISWESTCLV